MPEPEALLNAFVTLFVTIDPIGTTAIFVALVAGMPAALQRSIALRACLIAFLVLVAFTLFGAALLDSMGITIDAFRIAGGLLLFATAFEMVYGSRQERRKRSVEQVSGSEALKLAVTPLAIPLLAGPGTIAATILLASELSGDGGAGRWLTGRLVLLAIIGLLMAISVIAFFAANRVDRLLGATGNLIATRLLGVLLAALSVQFVADGVLAFAGT